MNILKTAEDFAKIEYLKNDDFHQWHHIVDVMDRAMSIVSKIKDKVDLEALKLAIIFHDIDYSSYDTHVDNSVEIAKKFLFSNGYQIERVNKVVEIMLNHSTPHRKKYGDAKLLEGKIIYDADKSIFIKDPTTWNKYFHLLYLSETRKLVKKV